MRTKTFIVTAAIFLQLSVIESLNHVDSRQKLSRSRRQSTGGTQPVWTIQPGSEVFVGSSGVATLQCAAEGVTKLVFRCNDRFVPTKEADFTRQGQQYMATLNVSKADVESKLKSSGGGFWCQCVGFTLAPQGGNISSSKTRIRVASLRKDFEQEPISQRIALGEAMELKCVPPQGTPPPVVNWYKIDPEVNEVKEGQDRGGVVRVLGDGTQAELMTGGNRRYLMHNNQTFVITPTTFADSGRFACMASNVIGERQSHIVSITIYRDGGWSSWSEWSRCDVIASSNESDDPTSAVGDVSCGRGTQTRERSCTDPLPSDNGGADCVGERRQSQNCVEPCPDERGWTPWSQWSLCQAPTDEFKSLASDDKTKKPNDNTPVSTCNQHRRRTCSLDYLSSAKVRTDSSSVSTESCVGDSFQLKPCSETDCEFAFVIEGPIVDNTGEVTLSPGKKRGNSDNRVHFYMAMCSILLLVASAIVVVLLCVQRQKRKSVRGITLKHSSLESHKITTHVSARAKNDESFCCCGAMFCFGCFCHRSKRDHQAKFGTNHANFVNGVQPSCNMNTMNEMGTLGGLNKTPFLQSHNGCASCYNIDIFPVQNIIPSNSHHSLPASHLSHPHSLPPGVSIYPPALSHQNPNNFYHNPSSPPMPPTNNPQQQHPTSHTNPCMITSCCTPVGSMMNQVPTTIMSPSVATSNNSGRNPSFGSLSLSANLSFANHKNMRNASSMKAMDFNEGADPRYSDAGAKSPQYEDPYFGSQNEYFDYDIISKDRDFSSDLEHRDKQLQRRSFCNAALSDNSAKNAFLSRNNSAKNLPNPLGEDSGFGSFSLNSRNDSSRTFDYNTARGLVGAAGGRISIPDFGASLVVPPSAIETGKKPEISLTVNTTEHYSNLNLSLSDDLVRKSLNLPKNCTLVSPIITVAPSDVDFHKPLVLTLPHFVYTKNPREQSYNNDEILLDDSDWSISVIAIGHLSVKTFESNCDLERHDDFYVSASSVHIVASNLAPSYCVLGYPKSDSSGTIVSATPALTPPTAKRVRVAVFASHSPQCVSDDDLIIRVYCFPDLLESWQSVLENEEGECENVDSIMTHLAANQKLLPFKLTQLIHSSYSSSYSSSHSEGGDDVTASGIHESSFMNSAENIKLQFTLNECAPRAHEIDIGKIMRLQTMFECMCFNFPNTVYTNVHRPAEIFLNITRTQSEPSATYSDTEEVAIVPTSRKENSNCSNNSSRDTTLQQSKQSHLIAITLPVKGKQFQPQPCLFSSQLPRECPVFYITGSLRQKVVHALDSYVIDDTTFVTSLKPTKAISVENSKNDATRQLVTGAEILASKLGVNRTNESSSPEDSPKEAIASDLILSIWEVMAYKMNTLDCFVIQNHFETLLDVLTKANCVELKKNVERKLVLTSKDFS